MNASELSPANIGSNLEPESSTNSEVPLGSSKLKWFVNGLAGGLMLVAAVNAFSFFIRSGGFGGLFGNRDEAAKEAIGFPFEIWRAGETYNGWMVDYTAMPLNVLTGIAVGSLFGWGCIVLSPRLNQMLVEFQKHEQQNKKLKVQFSVKSLLVLTTVFALIIAAMTAWKSTPQLLGAIYFMGPLVLILIAMYPDQLRWQYRAVVLTVVALGLIGLALLTGSQLGVDSEEVLLGIFVSWTPQSAFMAFLIVIGGIIQLLRNKS